MIVSRCEVVPGPHESFLELVRPLAACGLAVDQEKLTLFRENGYNRFQPFVRFRQCDQVGVERGTFHANP